MKYILISTLLVFLNSCISINENIAEFRITEDFYDKANIHRNIFFYDSKTGILKNGRPEQVIIKLDNKDKQEINDFYMNLKIKRNYCWYKFDDGTSSKFSFIITTKDFQKIKCDSAKKTDVDIILKLSHKINTILQSKKEYREAFPGKFEIL